MHRYYVVYVEDSSPKMRAFDSREEQLAWVIKFSQESPGEDDGYWIDMLFTGTLDYSEIEGVG